MTWWEIGQVVIFLGALAAALNQIGKLLWAALRLLWEYAWVWTPVFASLRQSAPHVGWLVRVAVNLLPFVIVLGWPLMRHMSPHDILVRLVRLLAG